MFALSVDLSIRVEFFVALKNEKNLRIEIFTTLFYRELQNNSRACENPVKANVDFNKEIKQYKKNVTEYLIEIICTRISHPRELLYDTLQINHHEMIIFSPCVLSTAIRYQSPSLEKMNRTKIVKQIEIYRRMLKLTLQFKFASSIHEKPEEIENGGFTLKPIKCSPTASLRRNIKTQEF